MILTRNKLYKKNLLAAREINKLLPENSVSDDPVNGNLILQSEGKERLILPPASLLYIEAMGNYIKIYYREDASVKKEIIRCSLKKAEKATKAIDQIVRCHRAYIVNLLNIQRAAGNAQGYLLKMKGIDSSIPVSRKFTSEIKSHLTSSKKTAVKSV